MRGGSRGGSVEPPEMKQTQKLEYTFSCEKGQQQQLENVGGRLSEILDPPQP